MNLEARAERAPLRSRLPSAQVLPYEFDLYQDNVSVYDRERIKTLHVDLSFEPILRVKQHVKHLVGRE